jgi:hypothetical protein
MPMLPARDYVSEHTLFIREFLAQRPDVPAKQREGREIWWDKRPEDLAQEKSMDEGRVDQQAYVYQTK